MRVDVNEKHGLHRDTQIIPIKEKNSDATYHTPPTQTIPIPTEDTALQIELWCKKFQIGGKFLFLRAFIFKIMQAMPNTSRARHTRRPRCLMPMLRQYVSLTHPMCAPVIVRPLISLLVSSFLEQQKSQTTNGLVHASLTQTLYG